MKTGEDLYHFLLGFIGYKYHLGVLVPKADKSYSGAFDCAEFISYGAYQVAGQLYGCINNNGNPNSADSYTGYWARDAKQRGILIPVEQAARTTGALLLRVAANGVTGHIVCCDGHGRTIEANSTKYGVNTFPLKNRRWDYGIQLPFLKYTESVKDVDISSPMQTVYRFTQPLMKGGMIAVLQASLNKRGYNCGEPDGTYGSKTMFAVREFQRYAGLVPDGEAGEQTLTALGM